MDFDEIKNLFSIVHIARMYGAEPVRDTGDGIKCKYNPTREEKTSSLVLYESTNTWNDYGPNSGGDIIHFVMAAENITKGDAVKKIKDMAGVDTASGYTPPKYEPAVFKQEYMEPQAVMRAFENTSLHRDVTIQEHKTYLEGISPIYAIKEAATKDRSTYFGLMKFNKHLDTILVLLPDKNGVAHTFRYRYKMIGEERVKWASLYNTKSSYEYCHLTDSRVTLIVEGTRDYLNAVLAGYSVIAIPSAKFKLNNELLKDRLCVFIDDDDGKNFMVDTFNDAVCEKIFFDHKKFKEITKCKSKDLSDYMYQFDSLETFKNTMDAFISDSTVEDIGDWKDAIFKITQPLTLEDIEAAENQTFLYEELIIQSNFTTIVAPPNTGKSAFTFGMVKSLLESDSVDDVLFLDPDSPVSYVKETITHLYKHFEDRFHYYNGLKNDTTQIVKLMESLTTAKKDSGKRTLIICDGLQFFANGEIGKDTSSKDFLELIKKVRDRFGATIVLLHHTKREKDDSGLPQYIGSQIIETITDNMLIMYSSKKGEIDIQVKKSRSDKKGNIYKLDIDLAKRDIVSVSLKGHVDDDITKDEDSDEVINEMDVYDFIKTCDKPFTSHIKKEFGKGVEKTLKEHDGKLWNSKPTTFPGSFRYTVTMQPEIIEYQDEEIESIFGNL